MTAAGSVGSVSPAQAAGRVSTDSWEVSTIGRQLYHLRTGREPRLTQEALAEKAGVSADVIKKLEQGRKREARLSTLVKIAQALEVDLARLVSEPGSAGAGEAPAPEDRVPEVARRGSRGRGRNDLIRRARLAVLSPSGSGAPMSRQELAEALNAFLYDRASRRSWITMTSGAMSGA